MFEIVEGQRTNGLLYIVGYVCDKCDYQQEISLKRYMAEFQLWNLFLYVLMFVTQGHIRLGTV